MIAVLTIGVASIVLFFLPSALFLMLAASDDESLRA